VTSSRLKTPKAAAANSAAEAAAGSTNSFTSARVAVFNPPRGLEEVADFCGQFFRFSLNKTSAVESSSHAPSRASGRPSCGAAHFFVARTVGWMEKMAHLSKMRLGSRYVTGYGWRKFTARMGGDRNPLPRSRPGQDSTLLTALSSQPKTWRWAESGVRLTERGELLGADAGQSQQSLPVPKAMLNIQRSDIRKDTCAEREGFHRTSRTGRRARAHGQRAIGLSNNPNE